MFRVVGYVIYTIIDNLICIDYLCFLQDKLSKHKKPFCNTIFDDLSGIGIPEVLTNIMYCHVFSKENQSTVILTCQSALISYYLSK